MAGMFLLGQALITNEIACLQLKRFSSMRALGRKLRRTDFGRWEAICSLIGHPMVQTLNWPIGHGLSSLARSLNC